MAEQKTATTRNEKGQFAGRTSEQASHRTDVRAPNLSGMMGAMAHNANGPSSIAQVASQGKAPQPAQPTQQSQPQQTPPPVVGIPDEPVSPAIQIDKFAETAPVQTDAPTESSPGTGERQTQPDPGQSAQPAESVEEARIPYDRFKEVNDKYKTLKTSSDEQILALRKELADSKREAEIQKLKATKPPANFDEMSAWEQHQWFREQDLKMEALTKESPSSNEATSPSPAQQDPRIAKLLLKDDLGLTSNDQADLVYDMQKQHPSLSTMDALVLAKAQSPESFSSPTANGTVPPANFRSTPAPTAPAPDQRAGHETPEQEVARSEREMQEAAISGNRQMAQQAAIKHFGLLRTRSGSDQLHQLQARQAPAKAEDGGQQ